MAKKTKARAFDIEEAQGDAMDLQSNVKTIEDHISSASSCETHADFEANIEEAIAETRRLMEQLQELARNTFARRAEDES